MLVGVDFDNTIVCYDELFHRTAVQQGLIPPEVPANKTQVRNYLRQCGKEDLWTEMQGYVYGARMQEAIPFPGVREFFKRCVQRGVPVCIVSHKTQFPFLGPRYDLHQSAHEWLESQGFFDPEQIGLSRSQVYFETTKEAKLGRIVSARCSHFIDDLPEFLEEPNFPSGIHRILFDPTDSQPVSDHFRRATSWMEIKQLI